MCVSFVTWSGTKIPLDKRSWNINLNYIMEGNLLPYTETCVNDFWLSNEDLKNNEMYSGQKIKIKNHISKWYIRIFLSFNMTMFMSFSIATNVR